jgi:O-antigen/teichoic acid export membrane protein
LTPPKDHISQLMNKKLLAKNTFWNFAGQLLPIAAAAVCVPMIIRGLGTEKFGILTLAWTFIGYFSLFDLGLGRAVTQLISRNLGEGEIEELPGLIWTALVLLTVFGCIGALLVFLLSPFLVDKAMKVPSDLRLETLYSFYIMALAIPFVIASDTFSGILESKQKFKLINLIRAPQGVLNFLGPVLLLSITHELYWMVTLLACLRFLGLLFLIAVCLAEMPSLKAAPNIDQQKVKQLLGFGGWMTVSNVIGPLMVTFDRFLIGSFVSLSAIAYYSTPYEAANKLNFFSNPLIRVLFPAFSLAYAHDRPKAVRLFEQGIKVLSVTLLPVIFTVVLLSKEGLTFWLGVAFAENSSRVLQIISIGIFVNVMAQIPFIFIQGAGRPDLTAKNHLAEFPFYLVLLIFLMKRYGINGVATAWFLRVALDFMLLYWQTMRLIPESKPFIRKMVGYVLIMLLVLFVAMFVQFDWAMKLFLVFFSTFTLFIISWFRLFSVSEREFVLHFTRFIK